MIRCGNDIHIFRAYHETIDQVRQCFWDTNEQLEEMRIDQAIEEWHENGQRSPFQIMRDQAEEEWHERARNYQIGGY